MKMILGPVKFSQQKIFNTRNFWETGKFYVKTKLHHVLVKATISYVCLQSLLSSYIYKSVECTKMKDFRLEWIVWLSEISSGSEISTRLLQKLPKLCNGKAAISIYSIMSTGSNCFKFFIVNCEKYDITMTLATS